MNKQLDPPFLLIKTFLSINLTFNNKKRRCNMDDVSSNTDPDKADYTVSPNPYQTEEEGSVCLACTNAAEVPTWLSRQIVIMAHSCGSE